MNKKLTIIILLSAIMIALCSLNASAYFTLDHEYWNDYAFEHVNSPIITMCTPYLQEVHDGQTAADIAVLHYTDSQVTAYYATHTKSAGFDTCMNEAGADLQSKCFCYGLGSHIIADAYAHLSFGVVAKYLRVYGADNYVGHMIIEKNFQDKSLIYFNRNDPVTMQQVMYHDKHILDSLFPNGESGKLLKLISDSAGLDLTQDAQNFRSQYKGSGFFDTTYKVRHGLPALWWAICIGMMIIGIGFGLFIYWKGLTWWKWISGTVMMMFGILGAVIMIGLLTGTMWLMILGAISVPAQVGYLSVSDADITSYSAQVQTAINQYWQSGNIPYDDVSGLSYIDKHGNQVTGALNTADNSFNIIFFFVFLPVLGAGLIFTLWKTFTPKKGGRK